ncbi:cytochrome P450 [Marinitenerispora sediminis]|uniref:Cytochrome P450 n=1 Tax=Marinitenerispora sediminis TaxID=1931232 RepID=A0A368T877_9ACTN|nr:cytochrome P450 [Marinitenerispora sediminis]RCV51208.1 cytochrome P450 [Marinitenerispora sediminis]RCV60165.1 cytochrome P450 [Marinitenerispora sediminis]
MPDTFDDPEQRYLVLVNDRGQHSLWPEFAPVPAGWRTAHGADTRDGCLAHVAAEWTDLRPAEPATPADGPPPAARQAAPAASGPVGPAEPPVPYPFGEYDGLTVDPRYADLRGRPGLLRVRPPHGDDAWLVTRHEDVRAVFTDPRFSRAATALHDESRLTPDPVHTSILGTDPPDHTRLRRLLARAFTARRIETMRPGIRATADELIDAMVRTGPPGDIVEDYALPLTGLVICDFLGIPFADRDRFQEWLVAFSSTTALPPGEARERTAAMHAYIGELVEERRRSPDEALVSQLIRVRDDSDRLSETELVELATVLLIAGYETSAAQLMNSVHALLERPAQLARLRAEGVTPAAVDELLRFVPVDAHVAFARYAVADVELGGTLVRAGEAVLPVLPSANRDPAVFEDPDTLDLGRERNPHLGFGHGIHRCLGAALARIEMEEGLGRLVARLPDLAEAAPLEEAPWKAGMQVRSLWHLPVRW